MTKRMAVGPRYRRGLKLSDNGEAKWFGPGELIPEGTKLPNRFFRDKRVVWVEDASVKKARPKPTPKTKEKVAQKTATPSPSSEVAGSSGPAPLEVSEGEDKPVEKKTKRKRKKLFGGE